MQKEQEWTAREKLIARFISWGIIFSVTIIIVGGIWTTLEFIISYVNPGSGEIIQWFIDLDWAFQILVFGALIVGVILGMIGFSIFLKRGQKFLLNLLFKIKQ
jgi:hypothetical protein